MVAAAKNEEAGDAGVTERHSIRAEQNRNTFLPRPSDDPNDPLNFPLWLKVNSSL
jgi:hypothetical protein